MYLKNYVLLMFPQFIFWNVSWKLNIYLFIAIAINIRESFYKFCSQIFKVNIVITSKNIC